LVCRSIIVVLLFRSLDSTIPTLRRPRRAVIGRSPDLPIGAAKDRAAPDPAAHFDRIPKVIACSAENKWVHDSVAGFRQPAVGRVRPRLMTSISNFPAIAAAENGHNSSSRARILVTDDRPEMLAAIDIALGRRYECEFAPSVGAAREKLRDEEFKLAICDVDAAGELAMALAEEIITEHPGTAVVLVTGQDDPRVADRAFALGVHGYLVEPLRSAQLLITVMNALRWRDLEIGKAAHARSLAEQFQTIIDMAPIPMSSSGMIRAARSERPTEI
jgi:DNA-binding NarL/FixJ family response regulator